MRRLLLTLLPLALLALPTASAGAATFGPDLSAATPNYPYSCAYAGAYQGCTVHDPMTSDMELVLPDPVANGDQTGVVTAIHVKSAATAPARFVVVEWSGKPGDGQPFPSGVMAVSQTVTLQPGINNFNTNLPVDRRLASNGFESWSEVALTMLDGSSPLPVQSGGAYAETGFLLDGTSPLTQTVADLTAPPHYPQVGGLPPGRLLMSGDVTITTGQQTPGSTTNTDPGVAPTAPTATLAKLTTPAGARVKGHRATLPLRCVGAVACTGTVRIQSRSVAAHAAATGRKAAKPITYATASFSVPAGATQSVKATLSKAGRKAARRHRSLRAYLNTTFADGHVTSARITLRR